jgi:hypothetical protein
MDFNQRVRRGKVIEHQIITQMRANGMMIYETTKTDDMYQKIDAWWVREDGQRHGVQIKFRETGDDVIFEVYKDFDYKVWGRDLVGQSTYTLCVNRQGEGVLVSTQELKHKIHVALESLETKGWTNPTTKMFSNPFLQLKLRPDAYHGQNKLVGFIQPRSLEVLRRFLFQLVR